MKPPVNFPYILHILFFVIVEFLIIWIAYHLDVRCKAMRTRTYKSPWFFIRYKWGNGISRSSFWVQVVNTAFVLAYIPIAILEFYGQFNRVVLGYFTLVFIFLSILLTVVAFVVEPSVPLPFPTTVILMLFFMEYISLAGSPRGKIDETYVKSPSELNSEKRKATILVDELKSIKRISGIAQHNYEWHSSAQSKLKKRYCKTCGKELITRDIRVNASKDSVEHINYYKTISDINHRPIEYYISAPDIEFVYKKLFCHNCKKDYHYATVESLEVVEKIFARVTKYFAKRNQPISIELAYETWDGEIIADTDDFSKIAYTCVIVTRLDIGQSQFVKFKLRQKVAYDKPYIVHVSEERLKKSIAEMMNSGQL